MDFIFRGIGMVFMFIIMTFVMSLPFSFVDKLAGWSEYELYLVLSIYYIINGIGWVTFRNGLGNLEQKINSGDLDNFLLKPKNTLFLISFSELNIPRLTDIVVGILWFVLTYLRMDFDLKSLNILAFFVALLCGLVFSFAFYLMINTLSFWSTETYIDHVANPFFTIAKYPVDIWGNKIKTFFYWVLPLGFVSSVPVAIFTGKVSVIWCIIGVGIAFIWLLAAVGFWRFALKQYSGVGR